MFAPFTPREKSQVGQLVADYPLAWVVSRDFNCAPLPLIAEYGEDGEIVSLLGHCGRRNPLIADFRKDPGALALFKGPDGYVAPEHVSRSNWGPTWNYAVVRFKLDIEIVEDETASAVDRLLDHMAAEGQALWSSDAISDRYEPMLAQIIGFRGHVRKTVSSFKLGQDEHPEVLTDILTRHENTDLTHWMRLQIDAGKRV